MVLKWEAYRKRVCQTWARASPLATLSRSRCGLVGCQPPAGEYAMDSGSPGMKLLSVPSGTLL
eukprot:2140793-Amphidinium_carterae.1